MLQRREGQLHLRFNPGRAHEPAPPGAIRGVFKQRGLADPRLSSEDDRGALPGANAVEKLAQARALGRTASDVWPEFPHDRPPETA